ncbi:MAG: bifunctional phosphopantothenoylcysteine decarboxylase/phosphopantothenate--cysteine ligase CoaBC [Mariprofundus sp.]|nr:bifunctional phosphopantothenoylcysteine decarboxylase/phosphopantothenate--cysteine ligase CoaBC [Mariprofundus sp.]
MLNGKKILIGIGGGIAVYRVAELARLLIKAGADVRCVMTTSACEFVTPLTFEALTGQEVHRDLFDLTSERAMGHIQLARWADAVIIAPATANLLARLTHGIADDLLSTIMLVNDKPVLLAPAMNVSMWNAEATQRNIACLQQQGMVLVGPESGDLACGEQGAGRLAAPLIIKAAVTALLCEQSLVGQTWVINAGPTHEAWDGVRILSNRASGQLGVLLAEQACMRGADVVCIAGPGTPATNAAIERVDVESAQQMLAACRQYAAGADLFIGTAAVSDFRFADPQTEKLKRGELRSMNIELTANPDIIASIAAMPNRPKKVIAFAAESSNHIAYAKSKLVNKRVDAIVANDISNMGSDQANGWWISADNEVSIPSSTKIAFAAAIIQHIMELA